MSNQHTTWNRDYPQWHFELVSNADIGVAWLSLAVLVAFTVLLG